MMRKLSTKEAVDNLIRVLLISGNRIESARWQGVPRLSDGMLDIKNKMVEVCDLFASMKMENCKFALANATHADIPWAEDHFLERLQGPSNPGTTYKSWPYANDYTNYLSAEGTFSHTYQERFWPDKRKQFGDNSFPGNWNDVKERLAKDITSRQCFLAIWHPEDQSNNDVRVPCTIGYWFKVSNGILSITYLIRSCDARRHLRNDTYMAQRLAHDMLVHLRKLGHIVQLGNMKMWIGSLHCFESDLYIIKKLVNGI